MIEDNGSVATVITTWWYFVREEGAITITLRDNEDFAKKHCKNDADDDDDRAFNDNVDDDHD